MIVRHVVIASIKTRPIPSSVIPESEVGTGLAVIKWIPIFGSLQNIVFGGRWTYISGSSRAYSVQFRLSREMTSIFCCLLMPDRVELGQLCTEYNTELMSTKNRKKKKKKVGLQVFVNSISWTGN